MRLFFYTSLVALGVASAAHALDEETALEVRRLDQRILRIEDAQKRILQDVRGIQRRQDNLDKKLDKFLGKVENALDDFSRIKNVDMANLQAIQKKMYQNLQTKDEDLQGQLQKNLYDQLPILNWGTLQRDCDNIGAKHQQVKLEASPDGRLMVRYLCYDGRPLHLSTELQAVPGQGEEE